MHNAARFLYLMLFPGLFLYHAAVALLGMPMFAAAWWSPWNMIAVVVLGTGLAIETLRWRSPWRAHLPFAALCLLVAAYAVYFRLFGTGFESHPRPFEESAKLLIGWVSLYSIGYFLRPARWFTSALTVSWAIMAICTLALMEKGAYSFIASEQFDSRVASYHWFASSFLFTSIALLAFVERSAAKAIVAGLSLPVLFVLSSKGELLALLVAGAAWGGLLLYRKDYRLVGQVVTSAVAASTLVVAWGYVMPDLAPKREVAVVTLPQGMTNAVAPVEGSEASETFNRNVEAFDPTTAPSMRVRLWTITEGWNDITSRPIIGPYAAQMRHDGHFGFYIHNGLSAWQAYGIVGFTLYLFLIGQAAMAAWRDRTTDFPLLVSAVSITMVAFVKSVYWPITALAWGLAAGRSKA